MWDPGNPPGCPALPTARAIYATQYAAVISYSLLVAADPRAHEVAAAIASRRISTILSTCASETTSGGARQIVSPTG